MFSLSHCAKLLRSGFQDPVDDDPDQSGHIEQDRVSFRQKIDSQIRCSGAAICLIAMCYVGVGFVGDLLGEMEDCFDPHCSVENPGCWTQHAVCNEAFGATMFDEEVHADMCPYAYALGDPRTPFFVCQLVLLFVLSIFPVGALLGSCGRFNTFLRKVAWDTVFCFLFGISMFLTPLVVNRRILTYRLQSGIPRNYAHCLWIYTPEASIENSALTLATSLTSISMFVPIRPIQSFSLFIWSVTSWFVVHSLDDEIDIAPEMGPATLLVLSGFAWRNCITQQRLRWHTWRSHSMFQERASVSEAMEAIAKNFCDVVVFLTDDLRLQGGVNQLTSLFGPAVLAGGSFTELLSEPDVERFKSMVERLSGSHLPGCITVTLQGSSTQFQEANLFMARTMQAQTAYVLGIALLREPLLCETEIMNLAPTRELAGDRLPCDAEDYRFGKKKTHSQIATQDDLSGHGTSVRSTEDAFAEMDVHRIIALGREEHWLLQPDTVKLNSHNLLGQGGFGSVFGGELCGSQVAVKFQKESPVYNEARFRKHLASIYNEIRIFRHVRHPNIVLFHGAYLSSDHMCLVLERVHGKLLSSFVATEKTLTLCWQKKMILDITCALWHLHTITPCVVHGDLKPDNIMVELRVPMDPTSSSSQFVPHAKLIDFGLSRLLSNSTLSRGGTVMWSAPEAFVAGHVLKPSRDIFSLGCCMFFISTRSKPFDESMNKVRHESDMPELPWTPSDSDSGTYSAKLKPLCQRCVCFNAAARPNAQDAFTELNSVSTLTEI